MDIDRKLAAKVKELSRLKEEKNRYRLLHEFRPGEPITYNTPEQLMQSGELDIMEEIAIAEFNILSIEKRPTPESKPLTWKNFIDLKKIELGEHRELMNREGYSLTQFKYEC